MVRYILNQVIKVMERQPHREDEVWPDEAGNHDACVQTDASNPIPAFHDDKLFRKPPPPAPSGRYYRPSDIPGPHPKYSGKPTMPFDHPLVNEKPWTSRGPYPQPMCPLCTSDTKLKPAGAGGYVYGCVRYPRCLGTVSLCGTPGPVKQVAEALAKLKQRERSQCPSSASSAST